jgi:hypothetical protein
MEACTANNLPVISAGLILQEEIAFEHGRIQRRGKKGLA